MPSLQAVALRVIVDGISIFLVFTPWFVLNTVNRPFKRGFYCDDESLAHPYKPSTVPSNVMIGVGITVVSVSVVICESVHVYSRSRKHQPSQEPYRVSTLQIPALIISIYQHVGIFLFGCAAQQTITAIGKFSVGRLRPHFFDGCRPDFSQINCTNTLGQSLYITDFVCTGQNERILDEMRLSFPSGHSSMSSYMALYLALYLQSRMTWRGSWLLKHFLSIAAMYVALYVCLSRISDYKHHWSDVLAGAFIGIVGALLTAFFVAKLFKRQWLMQQCLNGTQRSEDMPIKGGASHA